MKTLNWELKTRIAKSYSIAELCYAIADCLECVKFGIDDGYYLDEISVYRAELKKRGLNYDAIKWTYEKGGK